MNIYEQLKNELGIRLEQVEATVKLIDEGNTIPFIARYRKEVTGSLNDEVLRNLHERLVYLRNLEEKKEQVLGSIEEQGKLTEELKAQILAATTLVEVEDLYRPYRPKRRTRATIAKEKGLESEIATKCLILAIFLPIIPPILMQEKINQTVVGFAPKKTSALIAEAEAIEKYKELYDKGVITKAEFEAKKKQLLGL